MEFKVPSEIKIGGDKPKKSGKFDDAEQLTKAGGASNLQAIKVYYDKEGIVGFTFFYKLADQHFIKAMHNVPEDKKSRKKMEKRLLDVGPDDTLKEIAGHFDKYLRRITFTTYRGKCLNVGSDKGTPFTHQFQDHTFLVASGSFDKYIDYLQFSVAPLTHEFLSQFKPIQIGINVNTVQNVPQQPQGKSYKGYFVQNNPNQQFGKVQDFKVNFANIQPMQVPNFNYPQQQNPYQAPYQMPQQQQQQQQPQQQHPQQPIVVDNNQVFTQSKYPELFK